MYHVHALRTMCMPDWMGDFTKEGHTIHPSTTGRSSMDRETVSRFLFVLAGMQTVIGWNVDS